jgi:predicted phosphoadenosine phosphosulfate sulfurtransferase
MRISNLHHETAVSHLFTLSEIEPETWVKLTKRLQGVNTAARLGRKDFGVPKELPFMFGDWKDYRDFLIEKLPHDEATREIFRSQAAALDRDYADFPCPEVFYREVIACVMVNDYHGTKLGNLKTRAPIDTWRKWKRGIITQHTFSNPYVKASLAKSDVPTA